MRGLNFRFQCQYKILKLVLQYFTACFFFIKKKLSSIFDSSDGRAYRLTGDFEFRTQVQTTEVIESKKCG